MTTVGPVGTTSGAAAVVAPGASGRSEAWLEGGEDDWLLDGAEVWEEDDEEACGLCASAGTQKTKARAKERSIIETGYRRRDATGNATGSTSIV
ncbi:MAG TPA: hypothetical protein VFE38_14670 [Edaphobacter sp.]|nr:hypothetical protein [Edaphobacter sp.]